MPDRVRFSVPTTKFVVLILSKKTVLVACWILLVTGVTAHAAKLKPQAVEGWDRYVGLTEIRINREQRDLSHFLWIDLMSEKEKKAAEAQLRNGQVVIGKLQTEDEGSAIKTPGALIHHWIGIAFIPNASVQQALALVQDYNNHYKVYKPDVERSQLISRKGDDFKIYLRYRKKKIITVVLNTYHDVHYSVIDANHAYCRSYSTRVTEVEDPGTPDEHERSPVDQNGFMWRMNTYWRFEERNGGLYVQCEAITLTRSVPVVLRWLIEPYLTSIPHESLNETMNHTRDALLPQVQNLGDISGKSSPQGLELSAH
jgi:hypothetical protein